MGDDEVAGRPGAGQIEDDLLVEQDPAPASCRPREREPQTADDLRSAGWSRAASSTASTLRARPRSMGVASVVARALIVVNRRPVVRPAVSSETLRQRRVDPLATVC
jgi:hypothetical protein